MQDIARAAGSRGAVARARVGLGVPVDEGAGLEQSVLEGEILLVVHEPNLTTSPTQLPASALHNALT